MYREHSRNNKPGIIVSSGETFLAETELCSGDWLHSINDRWSPEIDDGPNPTVCVEIQDAKPGDILKVTILDINVEDLGYTGFVGEYHPLAYYICHENLGWNTKTVMIRNNLIEWNDKIKIPIKPMIGTLGTAPKYEVLRNTRGGKHGGNMDVNEVTTQCSVYLPVYIKGGLLHIGDVHAIQGDGEINGAGGVECKSTIKLLVEVLEKPESMEWIRLENDFYIMTVACCRSIEESFYNAAREMLNWMTDEYNFTKKEAYLLMGQVLEARCTQFVNPTRTYICKMPKIYL